MQTLTLKIASGQTAPLSISSAPEDLLSTPQPDFAWGQPTFEGLFGPSEILKAKEWWSQRLRLLAATSQAV